MTIVLCYIGRKSVSFCNSGPHGQKVPQKSSSSQNASSILTQSLMHELIFIGESRKACLHKKPESDPELGKHFWIFYKQKWKKE